MKLDAKNVWWIDAAVAIPIFTLAASMGANVAISLVFAFLAASFVNVLGALGLFRS